MVAEIPAFNPFKEKNIQVYINSDNSAVEKEIVTLNESIKKLLNKNCLEFHIQSGIPDWLNTVNHNYRLGRSFETLSEHSNAEMIMIVTYKRKSVYGLSGDKAFSGWIGGDFYNFGAGSMSSGSVGVPVTINITDENPEWQYQSTIELDIYDCVKPEKTITIIRTHEASSDNVGDIQTLSENIEAIFEEIDDAIFKKSQYRKYKRILKDSISVRSPVEINDRITAALIDVFTEIQDENQIANITKSIICDEYGTVSLIKNDSSVHGTVFDDLLTNLHLQRVIKPGDTAKFNPVFKMSKYFDRILVNGYFCTISAVRDSNEVWSILYHYLDEFVKHQDSFITDKRVAHVTFAIKPDGTVENVVLVNEMKLELIEKDFLQQISEWNFGDKSELMSKNTNVEFVCTFTKDNKSIRMK